MRLPQQFLLTVIFLSLVTAGCSSSEPARRPMTPNPDVQKEAPKQKLPPWTRGELPTRPAFYGHGSAPIKDGDKAKAKQAAKEQAKEILQQELNLLVNAIQTDHENAWADSATDYSTSKMEEQLKLVSDKAMARSEIVETFTNTLPQTPVMHVLIKLPTGVFYEELYAHDALPEEQKNRIKDYQDTFTRGIMKNLGRQ